MVRLNQLVVLWTSLALAVACRADRALDASDRPLGELPEAQELQAEPETFTVDGLDASDRPLEELPEAQELQAASTTLTVDGMEIAFSGNVSRSHLLSIGQEIQQPKGIPVSGMLRRVPTRATSPHPAPLPEGVAITRLFAVNGDRVWVTRVNPREDLRVGWYQTRGVDEGPKWEPGTKVDVYAEVEVPAGSPVYVVARGVGIDLF